jgi:acetyl esterase
MTVSPPLQALLDAAAVAALPPLSEQPLDQVRAGAIQFAMTGAGEKQPVGRVEERELPGPAGDIPVRVYVPDASLPLPVVAYFHGGGWVFMGIETHDWICRRLANATGAIVVSVEYRLAPEARFPAALDDCLAVTQWLAGHADELGGDPRRVAVAGDSAGGNLAAATALAWRDADEPALAAEVLVYPVLDADAATPSYAANAEGYLLTADTMRWFWDQYLGADGDRADPRASPIRATDLTGLPPALVLTAEYDPLRDEGNAYAARLAATGVPVEHHEYAGMVHGFLGMFDLVTEATDAMDRIGAFLRAAFGAA